MITNRYAPRYGNFTYMGIACISARGTSRTQGRRRPAPGHDQEDRRHRGYARQRQLPSFGSTYAQDTLALGPRSGDRARRLGRTHGEPLPCESAETRNRRRPWAEAPRPRPARWGNGSANPASTRRAPPGEGQWLVAERSHMVEGAVRGARATESLSLGCSHLRQQARGREGRPCRPKKVVGSSTKWVSLLCERLSYLRPRGVVRVPHQLRAGR